MGNVSFTFRNLYSPPAVVLFGIVFFFFQAEDGIRDLIVTGVQTCALPIYILSVDASLAKIRWMQKSSPDWASERPYVARGLIIAGNCRGDLAAFRASDGTDRKSVV